MKTMKKFSALLMALMMVFAVSANALAAEADEGSASTATVQIIVEGSVKRTLNVTVSDEAPVTLKDALDAKKDDLKLGDWKPVADWEDPTITHYALVTMLDCESRGADLSELEDTEYEEIYDLDGATPVSGYAGYYLLNDTTTGYHYLYAGYDWTYYILNADDSKTDVYTYMCCFNLTAGQTVVVNYYLAVTDWMQNTPLG